MTAIPTHPKETAMKRLTPTEKAEQLAEIALHVFDSFATDTAEIGQAFGLSKEQARTRLATLEQLGMVCSELQEDPSRGGLVNRGGKVGQHNVWQAAFGSIDDTTHEEATARIHKELGLTGPSKADIDKAVTQLQAEMSTPEFAAALAVTETAGDTGSEETPVARKTSTPKAATKAETEPAAAEIPRQETARMNAAAPEGQKWCPRHRRYEDRSMFTSNKASKDGLFSVCKEAEADDRKRWAAEKAAKSGKAPAAPVPPVAEAPKAEVAASPTPQAKTNRDRKAKAAPILADGAQVQTTEDVTHAIADRLA
jgi:hypothetical protein